MSQTLSFSGERYSGWLGLSGSANGDLIYLSKEITDYNTHIIAVTGANAVDVEVSLDGSVWFIASTSLVSDVSPNGGRKVIKIPSGEMGILKGKFLNLRILQNGNTDVNAFGAHVNT